MVDDHATPALPDISPDLPPHLPCPVAAPLQPAPAIQRDNKPTFNKIFGDIS